jgi:hypothetical protein
MQGKLCHFGNVEALTGPCKPRYREILLIGHIYDASSSCRCDVLERIRVYAQVTLQWRRAGKCTVVSSWILQIGPVSCTYSRDALPIFDEASERRRWSPVQKEFLLLRTAHCARLCTSKGGTSNPKYPEVCSSDKLWNSLDRKNLLKGLRVHCFPRRNHVLHLVDGSSAPAPELYDEYCTAALQTYAQSASTHDRWAHVARV